MKMKQEVRGLWVEALRSGEFQQGTGALTEVRTNEAGEREEFDCCLGVLCKLAQRAGVIEEPYTVLPHPSGHRVLSYGIGETNYLPLAVGEWAGLVVGDYNPCVRINEGTIMLSEENDSGKTFTEIAGLIEADEDSMYDG